MKFSASVEGLKDLDAALKDLTKASAKGAMVRSLTKAAEPIKFDMQRFAPTLGLKGTIATSTKLSARQRRLIEGKSYTEVYVGPTTQGRDYRLAHLFEFGTAERFRKSGGYTGRIKPEPFARPAWDYNKQRALNILTFTLWTEIDKATQRAQRKAARQGATVQALAAASREGPSGAEYRASVRARFARRR